MAAPGQWPDGMVIDRIVGAVGDDYANDLDRDALRDSLHDIRVELLSQSTGQLRYRRRKSSEIATKATELAAILSDGTGDRLLDLHLWFELDREATIAELRQLTTAARAGAELGDNTGARKSWLVKALAQPWESIFHRTPGISHLRDRNEPVGPFVRFVVAVASEMNQNISPETVAAAVRDMGKNQNPRA